MSQSKPITISSDSSAVPMDTSSTSSGTMSSKTKPIIKHTARKSTAGVKSFNVDLLTKLRDSTLLDINKVNSLIEKEKHHLKVEVEDLEDEVQDLNEEIKILKDEVSVLKNDKVLLNGIIEDKNEEIRSLKQDFEEVALQMHGSLEELRVYRHEIYRFFEDLNMVRNRFENAYNRFNRNVIARYGLPIPQEDDSTW